MHPVNHAHPCWLSMPARMDRCRNKVKVIVLIACALYLPKSGEAYSEDVDLDRVLKEQECIQKIAAYLRTVEISAAEWRLAIRGMSGLQRSAKARTTAGLANAKATLQELQRCSNSVSVPCSEVRSCSRLSVCSICLTAQPPDVY